MKIFPTPIRHDTELTLTREGTTLVLNGVPCDLAQGQTSDWIIGQPVNLDGVWQVTLLLPHGANAPQETLFPAPIDVAKDGPVALPPYALAEAAPGEGETP